MQSGDISKKQISAVIDSLRRGVLTEFNLPGGTRLYIDRPQPFLCVYRQPVGHVDSGTETLVSGQASFLIAKAGNATDPKMHELVDQITQFLAELFGSVLLLEICSIHEPLQALDLEAGPEHPVFRLISPNHNAPYATLQAFQSAIQAAEWPCPSPITDLLYADQWHPPELPELISPAAQASDHIIYLGFELSPFYRDRETFDTFPEILRDTAYSLGHVLKQGFYTFSHSSGRYRPKHYHELGQTDLTDIVRQVDSALAQIGDQFDLLLHVTPVNADAAWQKFEQSGFDKTPEFHYRPLQSDPGKLKRALYQIRLHDIEDPALHALFLERRDEMDRQITLMSDRCRANFLLGSQQIFGSVDDELLGLARELISRIPSETSDNPTGEILNAETFAEVAQSEIDYYRRDNPAFAATVQIRDDIPGLMVSNGHLLIGKQAQIAQSRVDATLQHEVGTHMITYYNGLRQPLTQLHVGLAGYEELQEGLAVLSEFLVGGLSPARLRQLAGRVMAVDSVIKGASFKDTFEMLRDEYDFTPKAAYMMSMRTHRGGGYVKDMIYLRGLQKLLIWLQNQNTLNTLFTGKIALSHTDIVEELLWRKILTTSLMIPRYLHKSEAQIRLQQIAKGLSVLDLISEGGL